MTATQRDAARWKALMKYCSISHVDDRDMEPVFEVQVPCDWRVNGLGEAIDLVIKEQE